MTPAPARYAVAGHPVEHSLSPWIHAEFARQTGEALHYDRLPCPLDGFRETVEAFAARGALGCNVTVPFKADAFALAAQATPRARLAAACNTLRFDAEGWLGDNTDGVGLVRDLERNAAFSLAGQRVLLLGAGGAAAGVLGPLLAAAVAEVVVANRSEGRAAELAARHSGAARRVTAAALDACGAAFDLVINATSSSLAGAPVPVAPGVLAPGALAIDLMYGPPARPFLDWAAEHGAVARDGLGMLVEQAAESFWVWRGVRPRTGEVLAALYRRVGTSA